MKVTPYISMIALLAIQTTMSIASDNEEEEPRNISLKSKINTHNIVTASQAVNKFLTPKTPLSANNQKNIQNIRVKDSLDNNFLTQQDEEKDSIDLPLNDYFSQDEKKLQIVEEQPTSNIASTLASLPSVEELSLKNKEEQHNINDQEHKNDKTIVSSIPPSSNHKTSRFLLGHMSSSLESFINHQKNRAILPSQEPENGKENSVASELLGNQEIIFSTPFLEQYAKKSLFFWHMLNLVLDDFEAWAHCAAFACTSYASFFKDTRQGQLVGLAVQIGLIANGLQKLSTFSNKVLPIREKQVYDYRKMNHLYKEATAEDLWAIYEAHQSDEESTYSTPALESLYTTYAVMKNIAWDQLGVYVILLQTMTYSLLNWSATMQDREQANKFVFFAALSGIVGTFFQYYIKTLSKSVPQIEKKALRTYIKNKLDNSRAQAQQANLTEQHGAEKVQYMASSPHKAQKLSSPYIHNHHPLKTIKSEEDIDIDEENRG